MNKSFWDSMVKAWCKVVADIDKDMIEQIVSVHSKEDIKITSGYSVNPLDDDDEEEDWDV